MRKLILFIFLMVGAVPARSMQEDSLPALEVGFHTSHYQDFVKCFFYGNDNLESQNYYLNWCARDIAFVLGRRIPEGNGASIIHDISKVPASRELVDFFCARNEIKKFGVRNGHAHEQVRYALGLLKQLKHEWTMK